MVVLVVLGSGSAVVGLGGVELVHAAFGEVAAGEGDPFVVEFGEDRGGQAEDGGRVREDLDDVGAAFDLPVQPLGDLPDEFKTICRT